MGATAVAALVSAVVGSAANAMLTKEPKAPKATQPPEVKDTTADANAAANQQRRRAAAAQAQSSTILTGPQGLGATPGVNREQKTLLGY